MNKLYSALAVALVASSITSVASASEVVYSYGNLKATALTFGTQRVDDYDVAILLNDPSIVGAKITKISVPFDPATNASDMKMWLTKELTLETVDGKKQTVPDILSIPVTVEKNRLTAVLSEPYTLTSDPIYVGYSFNVTELGGNADNYPVSMYAVNEVEGGFMMRTRKKMLKWQDVSKQAGGASALEVTLEGDFDKPSLSFAGPEILDGSFDAESFTVDVTFTNFSSEMIKELEYTWQLNDGEVKTGIHKYDVPTYAQFGRPMKFKITIPNEAVEGENKLVMTLTKVNGKENTNTHNVVNTKLFMFEILPVKVPLLEEYTGFWCGNCTRGYAALEHMNNKYPDRFLAVSIHNGDKLELLSSAEFPNGVSGFPGAWMDREYELDPYFGRAHKQTFALEGDWLTQCDAFCPIKVDVEAVMRPDESGIVDVTTDVTYIRDTDQEARIFYYLISDGLSNPTWVQHNYYNETNYPMDIREMDQFTVAGAGLVKGLVFNDILAMNSDVYGVEGSLPAPEDIVARQKMTHTYMFETSKAYTPKGVNLVQGASRLRVVAGVVEGGKVVNCGVATVKGYNPVKAIEADRGEAVATEYYDLNGNRVEKADRGVYVRVVRYADGSSQATKIVL